MKIMNQELLTEQLRTELSTAREYVIRLERSLAALEGENVEPAPKISGDAVKRSRRLAGQSLFMVVKALLNEAGSEMSLTDLVSGAAVNGYNRGKTAPGPLKAAIS